MPGNIAIALALTTVAGLSTTIGGLLGIFVREPGPRFMTLTLGFSGGVMILVSFVELLAGGIETIGFGPAHVAFFAGMLGMFLIDFLIPHEYMAERHHTGEGGGRDRLLKTGLLVALGIGIHNFPEGMATFAGALQDPRLGVAIATAIAIHNIPEGLAVSAPVFSATGSRTRAFLLASLSGLAEPAGAVVAALVLLPILNDVVLGAMLAVVAGIMVFISLDELVPVARSFGEEHLSIVGVVIGMAFMAASLWILQ
ncbi:MAG: zinc transporter ZupT [Anaerolineae bacterium]|nr:zinc transporter ZupT [Anaerolineae bacterium]NIN95499.1 zinc transporter ZupT [Anaerolineae bacterium]NIQ78483.1 zinc transporter ZupT [Anaerolineae bacterium]